MEPTFAQKLNKWRGNRSGKECAAILGIDYPSYRKYASGKRTPGKLARQMIELRMERFTEQ